MLKTIMVAFLIARTRSSEVTYGLTNIVSCDMCRT